MNDKIATKDNCKAWTGENYEKVIKSGQKNARNRDKIGRFAYIFVYKLCKSLIFKAYSG